MKKLIFAVLLLSGAAQAQNVIVKNVKCSLFGNLKVKVAGLEKFGTVGKGYLRANLPVSADCDSYEASFNQTMGRGVAVTTVDFDKYEYQRQESRGGNDNRLMKSDYQCMVYERSVLVVTFPKFGSTEFKNTSEKLVGSYYGTCR